MPDRDAQFQHINRKVHSFQRRGQPVISVDTKKKELVGDFRQDGREWRPQGQPEPVRMHDFRDKELGITIPYGVYDPTRNEGWVSVGIDHDTSEFALATIRSWWWKMGMPVYPKAKELLITADGGGSNGVRSRLWKVSVQKLADELGLSVTVCHFPPGTSKWNKIEHRMFCHITQNWRGRPLVSRAVIVNLIGGTKTASGLKIEAELDPATYETGIKVTDEELAAVNIRKEAFHGEWNYTIKPRPEFVNYAHVILLQHQDRSFQSEQSPIDRQSSAMLKGRDHLVAAAALQAGLKVSFNPYMFENCADETWQLDRFPTTKEKSKLGWQVDSSDLEKALPIRASSEKEGDFGVTWLEAPPSSDRSTWQSKEDRDPELPAAAPFTPAIIALGDILEMRVPKSISTPSRHCISRSRSSAKGLLPQSGQIIDTCNGQTHVHWQTSRKTKVTCQAPFGTIRSGTLAK